MNRKYEVKPEWTQQALVVYGGLIAIGVVILQALIPAQSLDLPLQISIVSFGIAMPFLAIMILMIHAQASYRYATYPRYLSFVILIGQGGAFIGVFAAFWHISWMAAVLLVISGIVGLVVYAAYSKQLVRDNPPDTTTSSQ